MNAYSILSFWFFILFLIGLGLIGYGVTYQLEKMDLERNGAIVKGKVIDINQKPPYRSPIVQFKTVEGKTITFLSRLEVNVRWFDYKIGQEVEVIYHKNNPNNCQINAFWEKNVGQVFLWGFGSIVALLGLFLRKKFSKKAKLHKERMKSLGF